ncbi:transposable element Tcb2 transposase [Trichonephila clavipes]|nr:transposable element Tcb2 transposase [Trichonephila clavipes]
MTSFTAVLTQTAPSLGSPVSSRNIAVCLTEGLLESRRPLRVLPISPTYQRYHLEWSCVRKHWTETEWNQIVFRDQSRFHFSSDDNRVHPWRHHGERLNPAFRFTTTHGFKSW